MLKNAYFYEKKGKNRLSVGGMRPQTPVDLRRLGGSALRPPHWLLPPNVTTLSSSFLALNAFYYIQKRKNNYSTSSAFVSFAILHLFFTSYSVVFVDGGVGYPSYASANI